MTNAEMEFYLRRGRAERSKAFHAGFRAIRQAVARAVTRVTGGFGFLHQPKAFQ